MTKEEFVKKYAENSGLTVKKLYELGLYAEQCDCDEKGCKGWRMVLNSK